MNLLTTFIRQLRHWAIHIPIWAIPSLIVMSTYDTRPEAIVVMIFGVVAFTILFSAITASFLPAQPSQNLQLAIRWGSRIRTGLSLIFIAVSLIGNLNWMFPDLIAGYISVNFTTTACQNLGIADPNVSLFLATVVQATLVSFGFLLLTLLSYLAIRFAFKPKFSGKPGKDSSPFPKSQAA